VQRLQARWISKSQKQKDFERTLGTFQILQMVQKARHAQRNKIKYRRKAMFLFWVKNVRLL